MKEVMMAKIDWHQDEHGDWCGDRYRIVDDEEQEAYMIVEDGHFRRWEATVGQAKAWCERDARHLT